ncbi:recombinase family protein, partial [Escherichia sp. WS449]|uniref:recombinase family protein n=1 Tax=Escherichia sp. WS449 TaxID=3381992 RepID=UPI00396F5174
MTGQRIGYIRVSTFDQNPERQLEGVKVDRAFSDKASGKDVKRPQLEALISFARTGDTVVVHSMDRLARNLDDLRRIVQTLTQRGVHIEFVKEHLSFTGEDSPMGTVAKLAMRQPFVLFKGLTFQKLCLPGAFRPGDHHN